MGGGLRQHSSSTWPTSTEIERSAHQEAINLGEGFPGVNKRRRKLWYKKGVTLHLYSGENKGFTLGRALKETGGDERLLVAEFDMMKEDLYEKLLRLALDDAVNCTVWRRFPIGLICFKWVETEGCHDSHFQDQELGLKWKKPRVRRREDYED